MLINGEKPSGPSIRARIGQGNNNTINSALQSFWREVGAILREREEGRRPADIPEEVYTLARSLWEQTLTKAAAQFSEQRQQFEQATELARQEAAEARRCASAAESRIETLQRECRQLMQQLQSRDRQLVAETARREQAEAAIDSARDQARQIRDQANEKTAILESRLRDIQVQYENMEKRLVMQLDEARQKNRRLESRFSQREKVWSEEKQVRDDALLRLQTQLAREQERLTRVLGELESSKAALHQVEQEYDRVKEALTRLQQDYQAQSQTLGDVRRCREEAVAARNAAEARIHELELTVTRLQTENGALKEALGGLKEQLRAWIEQGPARKR